MKRLWLLIALVLVGAALCAEERIEFSLVHPDSFELMRQDNNAPVPEGYTIYTELSPRNIRFLVKSAPELTVTKLRDITGLIEKFPDSDPMYSVEITLLPEDAKKLAKLTRDNTNRQLAIIVNGKLLAAATILSAIESGQLTFTASDRATLTELQSSYRKMKIKTKTYN